MVRLFLDKMELTVKNIEQAKKDKQEFEVYQKNMENSDRRIRRKSFKEMFGYEIILFEVGRFELRGERTFFVNAP